MVAAQLHPQLLVVLLAADHHLRAQPGGVAQGCGDPGRHALQREGDHGAAAPQHVTACSTEGFRTDDEIHECRPVVCVCVCVGGGGGGGGRGAAQHMAFLCFAAPGGRADNSMYFV